MRELLNSPRHLLLLDALGAFATSATTFFLAFEVVSTGLPSSFLFVLASIAAMFFLFSLSGYLSNTRLPQRLQLIAAANLIYCLATIVLCLIYWKSLTLVGSIYFPLEVVVVAIAVWEWNVARSGNRL
jgi:cytochrome c oxidase subunit IV